VSTAHDVKQFLQDEATSAYRNPGESSLGTKAANAAKSAAAKARLLVNQAEPQVARANDELANLHDIEDTMNSSLITEGKSEHGLVSAGSDGNERNALALKKLGSATGTNMIGEAEKLAAMKQFGSPKLMANMAGAHSIGRIGLGGLIGGAVGQHEGEGFIPGALMGAALTSPAAIKVAIDSGILTKDAVGKLISSPSGRNLLTQGLLRSQNNNSGQ
jgi:hypothetical protein